MGTATIASTHKQDGKKKLVRSSSSCGGVYRTRRHDICRRELIPSETELGPDRRDGLAVQHLDRPSENTRFLDLDMVGIKLLETRGLGQQLQRFLRA